MVELRPARDEDVAIVLRMLAEPSVARWWGQDDEQSVREDLDDSFLVLVDGAFAGWLLFSEETTPEYRHVGLDISLATEFRDTGTAPRPCAWQSGTSSTRGITASRSIPPRPTSARSAPTPRSGSSRSG